VRLAGGVGSVGKKEKNVEIQCMSIGGLPEGWVISTLGEISTKPQYGWTTKANHESGKVKLLRTTDITSGKIDWRTVPYCTKEPDDLKKYLLKAGDIVISRAGSVGVSYLLTDTDNAVFASYLIRFRPNEPVDKKYVYYYLKSPDYWKTIGKSTLGIAVPNVNATKLAKVKIPIAPENEQKRIVAEIEKQFSRLDEAVDNLKRVKANLKRYKASVLKAAVEGKLTEEWRAAHPDVEPAEKLLERILAERRKRWEEAELAKIRAKGKEPKDDKWKKKYKEPKPLTNLISLPELPYGWKWVSVDQIGTIGEQPVLTGPFGSNLGKSDFQNSGIPVLTIGCLKEEGLTLKKAVYVSPVKADELKRYRLKKGDLLFSRMAAVGRAGYVTQDYEGAIINYHIMRLRLSIDVIEPVYFVSYVRGAQSVIDYVREVNHGATRDGINTDQLLSLPVALPPIEEQKKIIQEIDSLLSIIQKAENAVNINQRRSLRLRQSILKKAFSGKLVA